MSFQTNDWFMKLLLFITSISYISYILYLTYLLLYFFYFIMNYYNNVAPLNIQHAKRDRWQHTTSIINMHLSSNWIQKMYLLDKYQHLENISIFIVAGWLSSQYTPVRTLPALSSAASFHLPRGLCSIAHTYIYKVV